MSGPISLPIGPGVALQVGLTTHKLSDHNRSEISIVPQRIQVSKRMADGTLRTFVVASEKRKFKWSWNFIPREDNQTVDGFWGAKSIINFHRTTIGDFGLVLTYGENVPQDPITVLFEDFSFVIKKRSIYTDLYQIDISLEEV